MQAEEPSTDLSTDIKTIKEETDSTKDDFSPDQDLKWNKPDILDKNKAQKIFFQCAECDKKIVKSNFYVKHVEEQHGGRSFSCCFCTAQFGTGELFLDHVKKHGRNKTKVGIRFPKTTFQCGECDRKIVKSTIFVKHIKEKHGGGKYPCSFCSIDLESGEEFLKHVKSSHGQSKVEKMQAVEEDGEFPCVECKKVFKTINYLQCHNRTVHQIQVTVCEYCCKEFKNRDYYKKHVKLVHEAHFKEKQVCEICSKTFKSKANLYHHKKAVHETSEDMICYICASVSKNEQALRKHVRKCEMKAKRGPNPLPFGVYSEDIHVEGDKFICKVCQKVKNNLKSLTAHIRVAHTHDPVLCHLCNNHIKNVDYLKKHYRVKHFITDSQTINKYVKMTKPEHEPNLVRQKNKQLAIDRVTVDKDTKIVESRSSELKKQRQEMVQKWRQMEEEQTRVKQTEAAGFKMENTSGMVNNVESEHPFKYPNVYPQKEDNGLHGDRFSHEIKEDTTKLDVKTEDDDHLLPECEVKLEASDDEDEDMDDEIKQESSSSESDVNSDDQQYDDTPDHSKTDPSKEYQCKECSKSFRHQKNLYIHTKFVHTHNPCSCEICGVGFKNPKYLQKHLLRSHKGDPSVTVDLSESAKAETSSLNEVIEQFCILDESGITKYKCPDCDKIFEGKPKLKAHIKNVHTFGHFLCPECGKEFTLKQQLKNHINNHHNVERLKGKTCEHCLKVVRNIKRHTKEMHTDEQFVCPVCAKTFRSRNQLRTHTITVHADEEQAVPCPTCSKTFANFYYMRKHLRLVHGNMEESRTQVSCEECGKQFANEAYMHHHKKYAHEVENSVCEMCNRSYKNKRALHRHMRYAHSGKDNYPSSDKNIPPLGIPPPLHQAAVSPSTTLSTKTTPPIHPTPPPPSPTPHYPSAVSPPSTTPHQAGQWYDQHSSVPMDMSTSQLELARQQLQYRQRMQMETQAGQWYSQQGQGWFPRL
eukprot:GFUD01040725.1.p1 GENE.GFUD01040725.1~~GFUD01040725.1.p1  ORF type:complete len:978 (+),score=290.90 GFUD01040725.1:197-3130(+)